MSIPPSRARGGMTSRLVVEPLEDRSLPSGYSYLVVAQSDSSLPAHFAQRIHAAGGEVRLTLPQIGVALADSDDPQFVDRAEHIPGVRSVVFMAVARPELLPVSPPVLPPNPPLGPDVPVTPDEMSSLQWGLDAIDAGGAWAQGASGDGVRVAVLDSGFRGDQPDLRFNRQLSRSVTLGPPGDTWVSESAPQFGWHGTYVAGIVGALDDGVGTVGVSPRVDLVAIKAFENGYSALDGVDMVTAMRGIVYAADIHADVLNMSFNLNFDKAGYTFDPAATPNDPSDDVTVTAQGAAEINRAFRRATDYAYHHGVTMVAGAGNSATDHDASHDLYYMPQGLPHVITVSATAPHGFANDPHTDPDVPASYSDYGRSYIDLAAPGGDIDPDLLASGQSVTVFGITAPAWALDCVLTTGGVEFPDFYPNFQQFWGPGTSFASPHVAGVAALVVEKLGGQADPDEVFRILKRSADDLGEPGRDAFYGHGRINAAAAVALAQGHEHHGYGGHGSHGDHSSGHGHQAIAGRPHAPGGRMAPAIPGGSFGKLIATTDSAYLSPVAMDRIALSAANDQPVAMSFQAVNGTAKTSDTDAVARAGTLTFATQTTPFPPVRAPGGSVHRLPDEDAEMWARFIAEEDVPAE